MRLRALLFTGLSVFALTPAALAGETIARPQAVVELFTSQGCSSCPPADALLTDLSRSGKVVALAYHVDYWDYIGWPDSFGSQVNSDLQRAYASSWGKDRIYTPQMVVNGRTDVVGSHKAEVNKAIDGGSLGLPVEIDAAGDMLKVAIPGDSALPESAVWLVKFRSSAKVAIRAGENSGRDIDYTQIVTGRQILGMWDPVQGAHFKLPLADVLDAGSDGAAILVQIEDKGLPGPILGAASFVQ